jgi:hypothetical protein
MKRFNVNLMANQDEFKELAKKAAKVPISLSKVDFDLLDRNPLLSHVFHYPKVQLVDLYKFVLQGTCGWLHLSQLGNKKSLEEFLKKELKEAEETHESDELFELLDIQTRLGRINLRSWKKYMGEDHDFLWELMNNTKLNSKKSLTLFIERWKGLMEWFNEKILSYSKSSETTVTKWLKLVLNMAEESEDSTELPLVSHSDIFRREYKPCYRIMKDIDIFQEIKVVSINTE